MAEAQKTAMLRIIEKRISSAAEVHMKRERNEGRPWLYADDRPRGIGGVDCEVHSNEELADDDRRASVIFNHLFDERAYLVVWRGAVGDDACADFKAQADGLTW